MKSDTLAENVCKRWDSLKDVRLQYEPFWNDIQKLVRIHSKSLYSQTPGDSRYDGIFDSTAPQALSRLASGLHSYLTNPAERWFGLQIEGMHQIANDFQALSWLEEVSDIIFEVYSNEGTAFNTSLAEGYLDIGAFGHCVILQEQDPDSCVLFRTYPVADCWTADNNRGFVDTLFRQCEMTPGQMAQEFGEDKFPSELRDPANVDKTFVVVHAVYPRGANRDPNKMTGPNKAFASVYVLPEMKITLKESGYDFFPYHVPRWMKLSNEKYGRSPAMECLPDIRMLNRMEFTLLKAGQKQVDPPLIVPDDGFLLPLKTHPGAIIFKDSMAGEIQTLEQKGNLPWAEDKNQQKRQSIEQAFHSDWLLLGKDNQEMTAFEVQDRRDEKLRLLAPMLGRLHGELLGPLLQRTYMILMAKNYLPPAPQGLQKKKLKLVYLSAAAKAQQGAVAVGIGRLMNDIAPIMQMDPTVADAINWEEAVTVLAKARGTTRKIIRSPEEIAGIKQNRQQQQQMQQMVEGGEGLSKSVLNIAKAKQAGGGL